MTLFEECREALNLDFCIVEKKDEHLVINILNEYPIINGNVVWQDLSYSDYDSLFELLDVNHIGNDHVYVLADDADIPVFETNLRLIAENIYDVTALSPKIFIFNSEVILQPLFPTETIRLGINL